MKNLYYLLLLGWSYSLTAQTIQGKIVDKNNNAISYMFVNNLRTQLHTHSNRNGYFELNNTQKGDTLQFFKMGFQSKKVVVSKQFITVQVNEASIALEQVVLSSDINASSIITNVDVATNPVKSSQEMLTKVPGLIIGQHAGGGKAEQIFYRGFDIDHGTDLEINVDGMPVNMVSHAHGQGYADLHFVIPEAIQNLDFKAGTYAASQGNFATTGTVNITTKKSLDNNLIKLEVGDFNSQRLLFMNQFINQTNEGAYIAAAYTHSDGPFESPQNFRRYNVNSKYFKKLETLEVTFTASHFESNWNASGQIPERAVRSGMISRFGAIDDTEGGETSRTNLALEIKNKLTNQSGLTHLLYYTNYQFELFSNFTFFLNRPTDGDQIQQKENRTILGYQTNFQKEFLWNNKEVKFNSGMGIRTDKVKNNQLSNTKNKTEILERVQFGDVNETNFFAFASASIGLNQFEIIPAIRMDAFSFGYQDFLSTDNKLKAQMAYLLSPKLSVLYQPTTQFQAYVKIGQGFHTNDSRLVLNSLGDAIPKAYTTDVGFVWKTNPKLLLGLGTWAMHSEQEFVYVGDEGVVEPNGASKRYGVAMQARWQPLTPLFANLDVNYTHARFIDEPTGKDFVPLAPSLTLKGGLNYKKEKGFYGGIDFLHMTDRPANEDNSIVAKGYTVTNLNAGYQWENITFGIQIQNLLDVAWYETQFATESRLQGEANAVEEIHFTPGTPFFLKTNISYKF